MALGTNRACRRSCVTLLLRLQLALALELITEMESPAEHFTTFCNRHSQNGPAACILDAVALVALGRGFLPSGGDTRGWVPQKHGLPGYSAVDSLIGGVRGGRGDLAQAREGIGELFARVAAIRHQAEASEAMVQVAPTKPLRCPLPHTVRVPRGHPPGRLRPQAEQAAGGGPRVGAPGVFAASAVWVSGKRLPVAASGRSRQGHSKSCAGS